MNKHGGYFDGDVAEVIDFSVNVNPLGPPPRLIDELKESLDNINRYPEIDGETGKKLLSKSLEIGDNEVILGNGATELIYLFAKAIKPQRVLIVEPTFTEYRRAFESNGSFIYGFIAEDKKDFNIDLEALLEEIKEIRPNVVVICDPNNPTGTLIDKESIRKILEVLKHMQSSMFIDESFIDFVEEGSSKAYIKDYPIFILRSMTKFFAIPGLRLGYGIGHRNLISKLNSFKEPWTLNSLALQSLSVLLRDTDYKERTLKWFSQERVFLLDQLSKIDSLKVYNSSTNFFLCRLREGNAQQLKKALLTEKIYIRTCEDFYGLDRRFFRIAIRTNEENLMLVSKLKNIKY